MLRRLVHGAILSAMLLTFVVVPASADTSYIDVIGRYSFSPPSGFTLDQKESTRGYAAFTSPDQQTIIYTYASLANTSSLDNYANQWIAADKKNPKVEVITDQPQAITLDGQPARRIEEFLTTDKGRLHYLVVLSYNGNVIGRVYIATPDTAWDAFAPQASSVLDGFHFLTASYPKTYTDARNRYSFTIPLGWQRSIASSNSDGTTDAFFSSTPEGSVFFDSSPIQTGVSLEQYAPYAMSFLLNDDSTIETSQKIAAAGTFAGLPSMQWEYFNIENNVRYHHRLIWVYSGITRYRISINTRDDHWDAMLPQATCFLIHSSSYRNKRAVSNKNGIIKSVPCPFSALSTRYSALRLTCPFGHRQTVRTDDGGIGKRRLSYQ